MKYAYVGATPRTLASGRPLVNGDVLDEGELELVDEATRPYLVPLPEVTQAPPAPPVEVTEPEADNPNPEA